jgi:error-prone DNA polymerase
MGFYHPATIARDAERHGHVFLPVDVTRSEWLCTIEELPDRAAVRLGLRYVKGLREATGTRIAEARRAAPFASIADLVARGGLDREELPRLAEVGALAGLVGERRAALWEAARAVRPRGALYDALPDPPSPSPLPPMTAAESLHADYAGTGLSLAPHPMTHERSRLAALGVRRAADLGAARSGATVRVAGAVVVRQRPGTAKGVVFLNLEDETGLINVIVWPDLYRRCRREVAEPYLYVEGRLQREDGVTSVLARGLRPLRDVLDHDPARGPASHDFH